MCFTNTSVWWTDRYQQFLSPSWLWNVPNFPLFPQQGNVWYYYPLITRFLSIHVWIAWFIKKSFFKFWIASASRRLPFVQVIKRKSTDIKAELDRLGILIIGCHFQEMERALIRTQGSVLEITLSWFDSALTYFRLRLRLFYLTWIWHLK